MDEQREGVRSPGDGKGPLQVLSTHFSWDLCFFLFLEKCRVDFMIQMQIYTKNYPSLDKKCQAWKAGRPNPYAPFFRDRITLMYCFVYSKGRL